ERGFRKSKHGPSVRPVRWKPGRRAVIELDLRFVNDATQAAESWHAFARVLPAAELGPRLARWRAAAAVPGVAAPPGPFVGAGRGWFATAGGAGKALGQAPAGALREALGAALGALHAAPALSLPERGDRDDLDAAERALEALGHVAADLLPRAHALAERLA